MSANIIPFNRAEALQTIRTSSKDELKGSHHIKEENRGFLIPIPLPDNDKVADNLSLSNEIRSLLNSGVNLDKSKVSVEKSEFNFNLEFLHEKIEKISGNGYFLEEKEELDLSLSFNYQKEVIENGITSLHTFEVDLSLQITNVKQTSAQMFTQKEDIGEFIMRFTSDILKIASDNNSVLNGVVFEIEDLQEISGFGNGKLIEMISSLISALSTLEFSKQFGTKNKKKEYVTLYPKRKKSTGIDLDLSKSEIMNFELKIKDITANIKKNEPEEQKNLSKVDEHKKLQ